MKLAQIIIKEDNEPDYTGIDDNIRQRLSSYKSHEQQWALTELRKGENIESIIDGLEYYRDKIKDNRFQQIMKPIVNPINPRSLTQITLQQVKTGQQQYDAKYGGISKREAKKILKKSYAKKLIDEPDLKLIKIERTDDTDGAAKALAQYAMNTKWCVSNITLGNGYLKKGPIYYIEYEGNKYLCHPSSGQLMNVMDKEYEISTKLYNRLYKHINGIGMFLEDKTLPEYIDALKYSPMRACKHARNVIKGRWPEAEPIIMQDPETACLYAHYVIRGRWPEAEQYIMQEPNSACHYANEVINGRWREAEPIIMQDPENAYWYSKYVIKGRWLEAEPIIMNSIYSSDYANDVVKGRWPEAEPVIMKDPCLAYRYAHDVIKGRWPEAEPYIMKEPEYAYYYAETVIKGRWPEAEPIMRLSNYWWNMYKTYFRIKDEV